MVECLSSMTKALVSHPVPEIKLKQKPAEINKLLPVSAFKIMWIRNLLGSFPYYMTISQVSMF